MKRRTVSRRTLLCAAASLAAMYGAKANASSQSYVVEIKNMQFGTPPSELHVGDNIKFQNHDLFRHTATARDGSFDLDLPPGAEATASLSRQGQIDIFCRFHPMMKAQLTVEP